MTIIWIAIAFCGTAAQDIAAYQLGLAQGAEDEVVWRWTARLCGVIAVLAAIAAGRSSMGG